MSLGALGQYGSDSSISDSGEEDCEESSQKVDESTSVACMDPLSLGGNPNESASDSDSSSHSLPVTPPDASPPPALPLPNIDGIVTNNASYSGSDLHASALCASKNKASIDQAGGGQLDENRSSVFTNPYEQAEAAKLAMLKKHVVEFDKKPATRGPSPPPRSRKQYKKRKPSFDSVKDEAALFDDNDSSLSIQKVHKHRSGVTDSLEPPKKYMKLYDRVYK